MKKLTALFVAIAAAGVTLPAQADTISARCSYYRRGSDRAEVSMPCKYSQRQGWVYIQWQDGIRNEFRPLDRNRYIDKRGGEVRRENAGRAGVYFRMEQGSIFVSWE